MPSPQAGSEPSAPPLSPQPSIHVSRLVVTRPCCPLKVPRHLLSPQDASHPPEMRQATVFQDCLGYTTTAAEDIHSFAPVGDSYIAESGALFALPPPLSMRNMWQNPSYRRLTTRKICSPNRSSSSSPTEHGLSRENNQPLQRDAV